MKADSNYHPDVRVEIPVGEARCLLEYLTGSRGKEQKAIYLEFVATLATLVGRK